MKAKYKEQNNLSISRRNFMKNTALLGTGLAFAPAQLAFAQQNTLMAASPMTDEERMGWFKKARFGLFLHWGLYSLLGRGTWAMFIDQISVPEMEKLARQFNPDKYNPNEWAELALEAGMRYAVLTTRHHDGFCLFDSKVSDFTSVKTATKRDFVAEYVEAFRKAGLKIGFYYSLVDWRFPGYFEAEKYPESKDALVHQAHEQVRELLTNYGKIDLMWFDGHWLADIWDSIAKPERMVEFWDAEKLVKMIRELQPHIIINNRVGGLSGDYDTPEQKIEAPESGRPWEVCQTIGDYSQSWCYQRYTPKPIRKSVGQLLLQLTTIAEDEGNYLLNVGPKPDGTIPKEDADRLRGIGRWLKVNGEAIYGSQKPPIYGNSVASWIFKDNIGYLYLPCWAKDELRICNIGTPAESAQLLATAQSLKVSYDTDWNRLIISDLPETPPDPDISVIKVVFPSKPTMKVKEDGSAWLRVTS